MESKSIKVTLITHTSNPIESVFIDWHQSRTDDPLLSIHDVKEIRNWVGTFGDDVNLWPDLANEDVTYLKNAVKRFGTPYQVFANVINSNIPVGELVVFTFEIENMPVTLREQLVRHREQRVHEQNSYWLQSSRARDLRRMHSDGMFVIPDSIAQNKAALNLYLRFMQFSEETFNSLLDLGIPQDDARSVISMAMTHRGSMTINLRNLIHMFKERSCFISQSNLWRPILDGMISELSEKIHPVFQNLNYPPCYTNTQFTGCPYPSDNNLRLQDRDPEPVCPIFVKFNKLSEPVPKYERFLSRTNDMKSWWPKKISEDWFDE